MKNPLANEDMVSDWQEEINNVHDRKQISTGLGILAKKKAQQQMEEEEMDEGETK
jgi:hypothetical protein